MKTISKTSQKVWYAAGGMGVNLLNLMMGSYLCSALLVGGFGESAIPFQTYAQRDLIIPAVWAVFAFVSKIVDGLIDIPMAAFTDGLKSKFGRRRPAILGGLILTILFYLLFLVIPNPSGATLGNTIYYGIMLCLFYCFYTLTMVTYYATFTEIVDNEQDRSFISDVKAVCDIVYFIIGYVGVRAMLNGMNVRVVALIVLPVSLLMLIPVFLIKEGSTLGSDIKIKMIGLGESIKCTIKNKQFVKWMIVYAFMTFGVQLFLAGINEYFSFVGMNMVLVMLGAFLPVPFTLLLYNRIMKKKGFGTAFRFALFMYSLGMLIMFLAGMFIEGGTVKTIVAVICAVICAFGIGSLFSVAYSIPAQLAAEEEARTGIGNSAMYFAVQGLFSGVSTGLATGVVLTALKGSETAGSSAIRFMTLIAAAGTFAAFLLMKTLPESIMNIGKKS